MEEIEPISTIPSQVFLEKVFIEDRNGAIQITKEELANMILWCNRSKLNQGSNRVAVVWKKIGKTGNNKRKKPL